MSAGRGVRDHDPSTRFVLYRGEWLAMRANVPARDAQDDMGRGPFEDDAVWVPNRVAAAGPDLLAVVKEARDIVNRIQDGAPDASPLDRDAAALYGRLQRLIERVEGGVS